MPRTANALHYANASIPTDVDPQPEFTGERFVPGIEGEIVYEHLHRYALARSLAAGKRVLDAACGEGYGSALVAQAAAHVIGVDVDQPTVDAARLRYAGRDNLEFVQSSVTRLPLPDASVDFIVSFETIEHLPAPDQPAMIAEFARVLKPGGMLLLSSPNRPEYSESRNYVNPFHLHELDRTELADLLTAFPAQRWLHQRMWQGSTLWSEDASGASALWSGNAERIEACAAPPAMYFVVLAAREKASLPSELPRFSLFADVNETERRRSEHQASEVLRLDDLLKSRDADLERRAAHVRHLEELCAQHERVVAERDQMLAQRNWHVQHLERLVKERDELIVERDRALEARDETLRHLQERTAGLDRRIAELEARVTLEAADRAATEEALRDECSRLERAITAQERIIAYRQSARWWFKLPWMRMRLLFDRARWT